MWIEQRWDLQEGPCKALWVGGHWRKRVCSPHSQIKSAVTDYRQSSEVGRKGISATGGWAGGAITVRAAPTSLGSREMKSR